MIYELIANTKQSNTSKQKQIKYHNTNQEIK